MEKFTQKWCIAAFIEPVVEGFEFFWKEVPLHVTLVGVFATDLTGVELGSILEYSLKETKSFEIEAGNDLHWGENHELTVVEINESSALHELADLLHFKLNKIDSIYNEPEFEGADQIFHSTVQKHARMQKGDIAEISSVSIVDMFPDSDGYKRKIIKTINLGKIE